MIVVIHDRDDDCVDPKDHDKLGRRHGELIPSDADALLVWREVVGDLDHGGHTDVHVLGSGALEHIRIKDLKKFLRRIGLAPT